jgi:hypothetical protein
MFNFLATPYIGNAGEAIEARCWLALFYAITACGFALWYKSRNGHNLSLKLIYHLSLKSNS